MAEGSIKSILTTISGDNREPEYTGTTIRAGGTHDYNIISPRHTQRYRVSLGLSPFAGEVTLS